MKIIVPEFMETLCPCFQTYCKPFGRNWVALFNLILPYLEEQGMQLFLAQITAISSHP